MTIYDPRLKPIMGSMNGDTLDEYGPYLTDDTLNSTYALDRAVEKGMESNVNVQFPRKAICIYAEEYNETPEDTYTPVWNVNTYALGKNVNKRIRIKAYDDFIDSATPIPNIGVDPSEWTDLDKVSFNLLPWYYLDNDSNVDIEMPSPGDIVMIDFFDRENLRGGRLLSIREKIDVIPQSQALTDARNAFQAGVKPISSFSSLDPGQPTMTPPFTPVDDLCQGPVVTKWDGEQVETVIIDGCPAHKGYAGFYLTMKDAAYRDGITLKLNSCLRTDEDIRVPDECGNGTKAGQIRLYNELGPGIAGPPFRPGAHKSGIAFDVSTGMPHTATPNPPVHRIYQWLIENAHKYGFIRTVPSERWHWEYRPGSSQFDRVPKDHPTWDSYFV